MDSEKLMLNLFKQQQYDQTQTKIQKVFLSLLSGASILGVIITAFYYTHWVFVCMYATMFVTIAVNMVLYLRKQIKLRTASLVTMLYACFVLIPVIWTMTGMIDGAPFISLILLVSLLILFSGKTLKWLLPCYLTLLLGLTIWSTLTEVAVEHDITFAVYIVASYAVTVILIVLYMLSKQKEFDELNDKFLRSSFRDELTQLYNRKLLDLIMEYEERLYKQAKTDYIIVMFDVDNFKMLNDERGHVYGDIVLRSIAKCIRENARASDFSIRYGGDEFMVVQTGASNNSIQAFTGRIETAMEASCMLDVPVTVSYGFAARSECETPNAVLKLADERLYENKQARKAAAAKKSTALKKRSTPAK